MYEIEKTDEFLAWMRGLRDARAVARITNRIDRLAFGNPGQVSAVGEGVSELKIDYGPGYRIYYTMKGRTLVILLCGGDKNSQSRDIHHARRLARTMRKET